MIFTYSPSTISLCLERANLPAHFISAASALKVFAEGMRPQLSPGARSWEEGISVKPPAGWLRKVPTPMANNGEIWGQAPLSLPHPPSLYAQVTISREKNDSYVIRCNADKNEIFFKAGLLKLPWRKIRSFLYFQAVTQWSLKYRKKYITRKIFFCVYFVKNTSFHFLEGSADVKLFSNCYQSPNLFTCSFSTSAAGQHGQIVGSPTPPGPGLSLSLLQKEQVLKTAAPFSFSF